MQGIGVGANLDVRKQRFEFLQPGAQGILRCTKRQARTTDRGIRRWVIANEGREHGLHLRRIAREHQNIFDEEPAHTVPMADHDLGPPRQRRGGACEFPSCPGGGPLKVCRMLGINVQR